MGTKERMERVYVPAGAPYTTRRGERVPSRFAVEHGIIEVEIGRDRAGASGTINYRIDADGGIIAARKTLTSIQECDSFDS